ncbi:hypothetical protein [Mucilaginibacter psychrotolerans]|uniref:hypothetical protein n=1 Tax=Mucilaginibacter psychrotolerans TaxID=1524096 RepID=UPI0013053AAA|nr:hypothetical protein [Mucilaginibacter psychrotolerans]
MPDIADCKAAIHAVSKKDGVNKLDHLFAKDGSYKSVPVTRYAASSRTIAVPFAQAVLG